MAMRKIKRTSAVPHQEVPAIPRVGSRRRRGSRLKWFLTGYAGGNDGTNVVVDAGTAHGGNKRGEKEWTSGLGCLSGENLTSHRKNQHQRQRRHQHQRRHQRHFDCECRCLPWQRRP